LDEGEKKKVTKSGLRKLLGVFRFAVAYRGISSVGIISPFLVLAEHHLHFLFLLGNFLMSPRVDTSFYLNTIQQIGLALLEILFLSSIFSFTRAYTFSVVSEKTLADLRHAVYEKIIWLPQTFFESAQGR